MDRLERLWRNGILPLLELLIVMSVGALLLWLTFKSYEKKEQEKYHPTTSRTAITADSSRAVLAFHAGRLFYPSPNKERFSNCRA